MKDRTRRSLRIDAMRGFAMVLVVMAHAIQRNMSADTWWLAFTTGFEMSLLATVSGYLAQPPAVSRLTWIGTRANRLLIPFIAWAPILWFMSRYSFTGLDVVGIPESLPRYLLVLFGQPSRGLWYLLILFEWSLALVLLSTLWSKSLPRIVRIACMPVAALVVGGILWALKYIIPLGDYGNFAFMSLAPYFILGLLLREYRVDLSRTMPLALAVVGLAAFVGYGALLEVTVPNTIGSIALGFLRGGLGVGASILVLSSIPERFAIKGLAVIGRSSMGVYAIQFLLLRSGFGEGWMKTLTSFAIALGIALVATEVIRRNKIAAAVLLGEGSLSAKKE